MIQDVTILLRIANRNSCAIYRMVPFPMTHRERHTQLQWNTKLTHAVLKDVISNDFEWPWEVSLTRSIAWPLCDNWPSCYVIAAKCCILVACVTLQRRLLPCNITGKWWRSFVMKLPQWTCNGYGIMPFSSPGGSIPQRIRSEVWYACSHLFVVCIFLVILCCLPVSIWVRVKKQLYCLESCCTSETCYSLYLARSTWGNSYCPKRCRHVFFTE